MTASPAAQLSIPRGLIRSVAAHRVVPFVGAGVSVGVRPGLFPTWYKLMVELVDELRAEAVPAEEVARVESLIESERYVQAAEVGLRYLGAYRFNGFLRQRFRQRRPPGLDYRIPRAIWALRPPLVITTNYDSVMRWATPVDELGQPMDIQIVANDQAEELALLHEARPEWPWLWHIHGTIERLSTLILAGSDYRRLYGGDDQQRSHRYERALFDLQTKLATQPLLYIGFSLSDPYVLQQIADVLALTKGKNAPSYALMKQGEGDRGALWENYNIQLVEYSDHGPPLYEMLNEIRARAFSEPAFEPAFASTALPSVAAFASTPLPSVAPPSAPQPPPIVPRAPVPGAPAGASLPARLASAVSSPEALAPIAHSSPGIEVRRGVVPRSQLEDEYTAELGRSRRLLVLSPRRGGARTMARRLAERYGPRVTWLTPPNVPNCTAAEYFSFLVNQPDITGFLELEELLKRHADASVAEHLVVVRHDGGPLDHLQTLGNMLRRLMETDARFHVLIAGEANCAWLRFNSQEFSLYTGAPVRHVPMLSLEVARTMVATRVNETRAPMADALHRAAGGHPGMLSELLLDSAELFESDDVYAAATDRLSRSISVRGVLADRLLRDDRDPLLSESRHARAVLTRLLDGLPVRRLEDIEDDAAYAEVRLYYDALVIADSTGDTMWRSEAVRRAAARALDRE